MGTPLGLIGKSRRFIATVRLQTSHTMTTAAQAIASVNCISNHLTGRKGDQIFLTLAAHAFRWVKA